MSYLSIFNKKTKLLVVKYMTNFREIILNLIFTKELEKVLILIAWSELLCSW